MFLYEKASNECERGAIGCVQVNEPGHLGWQNVRPWLEKKPCLYHAADLAVHPTMKVLKNDDDMLSSIACVPLGVVGVIAPFKFPLALALRSIAAALAMGNSVVLKLSLNTAVSGGVVIACMF
jgi:hypothetical protein